MNTFSIPIHECVATPVHFHRNFFAGAHSAAYACVCVDALEVNEARHVNKLCMNTIMGHCALRKHFSDDITINNTRRLKHRYKRKEFRLPTYTCI